MAPKKSKKNEGTSTLRNYQKIGMICEDMWRDAGMYGDDPLPQKFKDSFLSELDKLIAFENKIIALGFIPVDFFNGKLLAKPPKKLPEGKKPPLFAQAFKFLFEKNLL